MEDEVVTLPTRRMMPPIVPAKERQGNVQRIPSSTAATTYEESTLANDETTSIATMKDEVRSTAGNTVTVNNEVMTITTTVTVNAEETTTSTAVTTSMLITAMMSTETVDVVDLEENSDSDDYLNPGEMPGIDTDTDEYEDWIPILRNATIMKNSR